MFCGFVQDAQRPVDHLLPGGRDARRACGRSRTKMLEAQLVLQQLDLLAEAGCEVCSFAAAAVMFRPFCATAARNRNCCSFIATTLEAPLAAVQARILISTHAPDM